MRHFRARPTLAGGPVSACRIFIAAAGLLTSALATAQTFPSQYANALQRAAYSMFIGDVNNDGHTDVLAKAKIKLVIVDVDVLIPIVIKPPSATFVLLSQTVMLMCWNQTRAQPRCAARLATRHLHPGIRRCFGYGQRRAAAAGSYPGVAQLSNHHFAIERLANAAAGAHNGRNRL